MIYLCMLNTSDRLIFAKNKAVIPDILCNAGLERIAYETVLSSNIRRTLIPAFTNGAFVDVHSDES